MKKTIKRIALVILPLVMTAACSGVLSQNEIDELNEIEAIGSPFTQKLANEYRAMANYEQNEAYDYTDALHFARKGLLAAQGENVLPEPIENWNISEKEAAVFIEQRARLFAALDAGARDMAPLEAAIAQARYDCWIEEQEESWQDKEKVELCKQEYMSAIERVESVVDTSVTETTDDQPTAEQPEGELAPIVSPEATDLTTLPNIDDQADLALEDAMFLVFYDFDSSKIEAGAEDVVAAVAEQIRSRDDVSKVIVKGHADTSGPADYNERLSKRRAEAVKSALVEMGVDADVIETRAFGETSLLVETPNGTREPANRRSEVTFE